MSQFSKVTGYKVNNKNQLYLYVNKKIIEN